MPLPSISRIKIERFKRASSIDFALGDVNVLVGANNSGKSSAIQGLHFVITLFQSIALANRWQRRLRTTIFPEELIFSPADDPYRLYEQGQLQQSTFIEFKITLDDGRLVSVDLTKGKNANLSARVDPIEPAQDLSSLTSPFSVYSPGLAGIARREQYVSDGVLLRAVSRGDANLFLRNIIYRLSRNDGWPSFARDLQSLFGDLEISVAFEDASDESILVNVLFGDRRVPLESCGTGLLQAIQILSYVHYFKPSIIILDEPDSHLHPNNQRLLCDLLVYISDEYHSKIVLTTHSRHVIDSLKNRAQFVWIQNGSASQATADDHLDILMDLGALDIREAARANKKYFILTEDKLSKNIKSVLISSGFDEESFVIQSYFGVTEPHKLQVVVDVIRELQPNSTIIVHRDRDFLNQSEVDTWTETVRAMGAEPFITRETDIEDYFLNPNFLSAANPNLSPLEASAYILRAVEELTPQAIVDYTNGRLDVLRKSGVRNINHGQIALESNQIIQASPRSGIKGKTLRAAVRRIFQAERGVNLRTEGTGVELNEPILAEIVGRNERHN